MMNEEAEKRVGPPPTDEMAAAATEGSAAAAAAGMKKRAKAQTAQGIRSGKADDPIESMSDKFCTYINQANAGNLLMIAWHHAHKPETIIGQLISVDRLGIWIRCHMHGAVYTEERINFKGPIDDAKKVLHEITVKMAREAGVFQWPAGPLVWLVLLVYVIIGVIYYEGHGDFVRGLALLPGHWQEHLPDREVMNWGFLFIAFAHMMQGLACTWLLHKRARLSTPHLVQWFVACSTLGYPVACQVLCIKRADTHGKLKKLW